MRQNFCVVCCGHLFFRCVLCIIKEKTNNYALRVKSVAELLSCGFGTGQKKEQASLVDFSARKDFGSTARKNKTTVLCAIAGLFTDFTAKSFFRSGGTEETFGTGREKQTIAARRKGKSRSL